MILPDSDVPIRTDISRSLSYVPIIVTVPLMAELDCFWDASASIGFQELRASTQRQLPAPLRKKLVGVGFNGWVPNRRLPSLTTSSCSFP